MADGLAICRRVFLELPVSQLVLRQVGDNPTRKYAIRNLLIVTAAIISIYGDTFAQGANNGTGTTATREIEKGLVPHSPQRR